MKLLNYLLPLLVAGLLSACGQSSDFVPPAVTAPQDGESIVSRVCTDQPSRLAPLKGVYLEDKRNLYYQALRTWELSEEAPRPRFTELVINADGTVRVSTEWREAVNFGLEFPHTCFKVIQNKASTVVTMAEVGMVEPHQFVKLPMAYGGPDAPYFGLIFKGCYVDQASRRWCMGPKTVTIDGVEHDATLILNNTNLPKTGTVLKISGEKNLWVFKPTPDGFLVAKTSVGPDEPDWSKPYAKLIAEDPNGAASAPPPMTFKKRDC